MHRVSDGLLLTCTRSVLTAHPAPALQDWPMHCSTARLSTSRFSRRISCTAFCHTASLTTMHRWQGNGPCLRFATSAKGTQRRR